MARTGALPLLALLVLLTAPAGAQDRVRTKDVRDAVARGRKALERALGQGLLASRTCSQYALGKQALACFAALRSGTRAASLDRQFAAMRQVRFAHVYCVSVYVLAVEARSVVRRRRSGPNRIVSFKRNEPSPADLAQLARGAKWLLRARTGQGVWHYGGPPEGAAERKGPLRRYEGAGDYDHSNTQLAIYALHAASASGVEVGGAEWQELLTHVAGIQARRGARVDLRDLQRAGVSSTGTQVRSTRWSYAAARGWSYRGPTPAKDVTTTMTAAGLSCVAMASERLRGLAAETAGQALAPVSIRDGVAWLVKNWRITDYQWTYYELWTIEKAFSAAGVEQLDKKRHWWQIGAAWLLKQQQPGGTWRSSAIETSFALLFLNRGTLPVWEAELRVTPVQTGTRSSALGVDWSLVTLSDGAKLDLRQTFDALLKTRSDKVARDLLREAKRGLAAMPRVTQVRALPWLIGLLESKRGANRRWARKSCKALLGGGEMAWRRWLAEWLAVESALERRDPLAGARVGVAAARRLLSRADRPSVLRRAAAQVLVRVRSVESAGALIESLGEAKVEDRRWAWTMLSTLVGRRRPFDPEASAARRNGYLLEWRAWWRRSGPAFVAREARWRDVSLLAHTDTRRRASDRLIEHRSLALPALVAGLSDPSLRRHAHGILVRLTGQRFPAIDRSGWRSWLAKQ